MEGALPFLAPSPRFIFPRGAEFTDLASCLADRHARYARAHKEIERVDVVDRGPGAAIVYVLGTLHGERLDGTPFAGARFIDRFTFEEGRIAAQEVWNDLSLV